MNSHNPLCPGFTAPSFTRREFLRRANMAFGSLAFSALAPRWTQAAMPSPHFTAKAKRVIFLFMDGGVSQMDSFDPKLELTKRDGQLAELDLLREQNTDSARALGGSDAIESAIKNYETAAQMQTSVPRLCDVSGESAATLKMYGVDRQDDYQRFYSLQCLRARRLIEAGVRFIEITCPLTHNNNAPWDQHSDLRQHHGQNALITDQPVAALLTDLKARDLGMAVVDKRTDIHDLHATILHQLGLDHERLTYRFGGRDMRLTDVHGHVLKEIVT